MPQKRVVSNGQISSSTDFKGHRKCHLSTMNLCFPCCSCWTRRQLHLFFVIKSHAPQRFVVQDMNRFSRCTPFSETILEQPCHLTFYIMAISEVIFCLLMQPIVVKTSLQRTHENELLNDWKRNNNKYTRSCTQIKHHCGRRLERVSFDNDTGMLKSYLSEELWPLYVILATHHPLRHKGADLNDQIVLRLLLLFTDEFQRPNMLPARHKTACCIILFKFFSAAKCRVGRKQCVKQCNLWSALVLGQWKVAEGSGCRGVLFPYNRSTVRAMHWVVCCCSGGKVSFGMDIHTNTNEHTYKKKKNILPPQETLLEDIHVQVFPTPM